MTVLKAPRGKFRVVGVDTFEGPTSDYLIGDYITLEEAKRIVAEQGGEMNPVYCYDDKGELCCSAGKP